MSDVVRLEYRNVTMRFAAASAKSLTAVQGVSFSVRDGEVVSLIGPSGCGKSTLLNIGSGLYSPSEGAAFVDGERVEGPNAHVGGLSATIRHGIVLQYDCTGKTRIRWSSFRQCRTWYGSNTAT